MKVRVSDRTARKIKGKHGLEWDDVTTIFTDDEKRMDFRTGHMGISYGITESGAHVTVITIRKGGVRWVKTARHMTGSEKRVFNRARR